MHPTLHTVLFTAGYSIMTRTTVAAKYFVSVCYAFYQQLHIIQAVNTTGHAVLLT